MVELKVRLTGKRIVSEEHDGNKVTVEGNIHRIYFMTPAEDSQMICELNRENDVWITFRGRLLCVKSSQENEVIIWGDIDSFEGTMEDDSIRKYDVTPNGIFRSFPLG